jgi:hypothetical protein
LPLFAGECFVANTTDVVFAPWLCGTVLLADEECFTVHTTDVVAA